MHCSTTGLEKFFPHGCNLGVERIDSKWSTFDFGVRANFVQEIQANASGDNNAKIAMLDSFGTIQDIINITF